jgi:hypothetical protein
MSHEYKKEIMRKCLGIFGEIYLQRQSSNTIDVFQISHSQMFHLLFSQKRRERKGRQFPVLLQILLIVTVNVDKILDLIFIFWWKILGKDC